MYILHSFPPIPLPPYICSQCTCTCIRHEWNPVQACFGFRATWPLLWWWYLEYSSVALINQSSGTLFMDRTHWSFTVLTFNCNHTHSILMSLRIHVVREADVKSCFLLLIHVHVSALLSYHLVPALPLSYDYTTENGTKTFIDHCTASHIHVHIHVAWATLLELETRILLSTTPSSQARHLQ